MWVRAAVMIVVLAGCDRVFGLDPPELPPGEWAMVAAGDLHTCAIKLDGTLWCWGGNERGELGLASVGELTPQQLGAETWSAISSRGATTCGIRTGGALSCWGSNADGELGVGNEQRQEGPQDVPGGPWVAVDAGRSHTCAIAADTTLWCWGQNHRGQVGNGTAGGNVTSPVQLPGVGWTQVSTGGLSHTCGRRGTDELWCWGNNSDARLANPNATDQASPHRAPGAWTSVDTGAEFTCARAIEGNLRCWGTNDQGQLGDGTTRTPGVGTVVGGNTFDWTVVAAGREHTCGLRQNGQLYCWGDNTRGQIPSENVGPIVPLPTLLGVPDAYTGGAPSEWLQVSVGGRHTCAIDGRQRLWCAGGNGGGQLGRGVGLHLVPARVPGTWRDISTLLGFTCALDDQREARCWGNNASYQLGDGTGVTRQVPTAIAASGPWEALTVGYAQACVRRGAARWCWGNNGNGQLGNGLDRPAFLPLAIEDGHWPTSASSFMCSADSGALFCWGSNTFGGLGLGDLVNRFVPEQVDAASGSVWDQVMVGERHACGQSSLGLRCWGTNSSGQLGDGTSVTSLVPIHISDVPVDQIVLGEANTCVLRDGAASCWGRNNHGQLGTGDTTSRQTPTPIPGSWRALSLGFDYTCGVRREGTLWCWGQNQRGRLGTGGLGSEPLPAQLGVDTDWDRVATGAAHACAVKVDGSLWCWGSNENGELGDGTAWSQELEQVR